MIDWSLSTSYNPQAAPGEQWGDISSGLTVKPGQSRYLKLKVSNSIDPYTLALMSTRFTYGLSFTGRLDVGEVQEMEEPQRNSAIDQLGIDLAAEADSLQRPWTVRRIRRGRPVSSGPGNRRNSSTVRRAVSTISTTGPGGRKGRASKDPTEGGRFIPFDVNASFSYSYTNVKPVQEGHRQPGHEYQPDPELGVPLQASFDLVEGVPIRQQYSLHRDLHCWRIEFNRTISTVDSQFGFRIYLKSIPSLKFSRGREDYMGSVGGPIGGGVF